MDDDCMPIREYNIIETRKELISDILATYKYESKEQHVERARFYEAYVFEKEQSQAEVLTLERVK